MGQPASPDIIALLDDLAALKRAAEEIAAAVDDARFQHRPSPTSWSASECILHLSITTRTMLPRIEAALKQGEASRRPDTRRYARDVWGWVLGAVLEPPPRWSKMPTLPPFVPAGPKPKAETLREFGELHDQLIALARRADGLDLASLKTPSPFNERIHYNVYSAFRIITAHQRRHLWQVRLALAAG